MSFTLAALAIAAGLLVAMLVLLDAGRRIGARRLARDGEGARAGIGVVEGSVFGLLGLLLAFSFSGANARFEARRHLIVEEVNAIGTAWLRIDALPPELRPELKDGFRRYLDARLAAYRKLPDLSAAMEELARSKRIQDEIWARATTAVRTPGGEGARMLLLPALNAMFDIAETRTMAARMHPPMVIFVMLGVLALGGALLAGYGMAAGRHRSWIHMVGFAATIAVAIYVILDLEFPRMGFIRVDDFDQALVELRASMK